MWDWGCSSVGEHLPSMHEALGKVPTTAEKEGKKKKKERMCMYWSYISFIIMLIHMLHT